MTNDHIFPYNNKEDEKKITSLKKYKKVIIKTLRNQRFWKRNFLRFLISRLFSASFTNLFYLYNASTCS